MAGIRRIFDILENYKQKYPDLQDALAGKVHKTWIKYSVNDYIENSNYVTVGLLELGLKKGDKIAIISSSMPEWNFLDMGSLQAGIRHAETGRYPDSAHKRASQRFTAFVEGVECAQPERYHRSAGTGCPAQANPEQPVRRTAGGS